jgi:hypothetical protein
LIINRKILFCLFLLFTVPAYSVTIDGVKFDEELKISEKFSIPLRNAQKYAPFRFSIYAVALYVDGKETDNMKLKDADVPMALQLVSLSRLLRLNTLIKELRRGFSYGMDHDKEFLETIQDNIEAFVYIFERKNRSPKRYEKMIFSYEPGVGTHIHFEERYLGTIPGHDFKRALFGIWLNDNCANNQLRNDIIKIRK